MNNVNEKCNEKCKDVVVRFRNTGCLSLLDRDTLRAAISANEGTHDSYRNRRYNEILATFKKHAVS